MKKSAVKQPPVLPSAPEDGSTTPAIVQALAVLVALGLVVAAVTSIQLARVKMQTVADLAALAAGQIPSALLVSPPDPTGPCTLAAQVAERGDAELSECWAEGVDIRVVVTRRVTPLGLPWVVTARARAGPVDG